MSRYRSIPRQMDIFSLAYIYLMGHTSFYLMAIAFVMVLRCGNARQGFHCGNICQGQSDEDPLSLSALPFYLRLRLQDALPHGWRRRVHQDRVREDAPSSGPERAHVSRLRAGTVAGTTGVSPIMQASSNKGEN